MLLPQFKHEKEVTSSKAPAAWGVATTSGGATLSGGKTVNEGPQFQRLGP